MEEEIWKPIEGYEEYYSVSNKGRVKSNDRKVWNGFGYYLKKERILKNVLNPSTGYYHVVLCNGNGDKNTYTIHKLVAEAFVPKPEKNVEVNHKDGDKNNNAVENLEWCSRSENLMHSCYVLEKHVKKVRCIETGAVYPSIKAAARHAGFHHTAISMCCDGRQKKTHGTHWEYA